MRPGVEGKERSLPGQVKDQSLESTPGLRVIQVRGHIQWVRSVPTVWDSKT